MMYLRDFINNEDDKILVTLKSSSFEKDLDIITGHVYFNLELDKDMNTIKKGMCLNDNIPIGFNIKALYPYDYKVEKFNPGDRVKYNGKVYYVGKKYDKPITDLCNLKDYKYGYWLLDEYGMTYDEQGDYMTYYPTDDELELAENNISILSEDKLYELMTNTGINPDETIFDNYSIYEIKSNYKDIKYNKLIRDDDNFKLYFRIKDGDIIPIAGISSLSLYNNNDLKLYMIGNVIIDKENFDGTYLNELYNNECTIVLYYKDNIILERPLEIKHGSTNYDYFVSINIVVGNEL